jgi:hypothetical protein
MRAAERQVLDRPAIYQIRVPGELDASWSDWVRGMTTSVASEGDDEYRPVTALTGSFDPAALHGPFNGTRDSRPTLLSVHGVGPNTEEE